MFLPIPIQVPTDDNFSDDVVCILEERQPYTLKFRGSHMKHYFSQPKSTLQVEHYVI